MDTWTSRKFILSILALVLVFFLTLAGLIKSNEFMDFIKFVLGTYMVANVAGKFVPIKEEPQEPLNEINTSTGSPIESVTIKGK